ncbi:MAG: amylo-alpha-1,6-glucosidase [Sphingosinicella sp.]|uniref:amylo-alpha-1,6-glucosidase n=1 Tax=Sphingosinicella sp. TaxID=1917971 RepID=UPI004037E0BF
MNETALATAWSGARSDPDAEDYHIEATKSLVERTLRTLKQGDLFGVFDKQGDCRGGEGGPDGLFFQDTRFLSQLQLTLGGADPLLLSSVVLDDNGAFVVDLANADLYDGQDRLVLQRDSIHVGRLKFLHGQTCYERIRLTRFNPLPGPIPLELTFASDFADLFEVRGEERPRRGTLRAERVDERTVRFLYLGLDEVKRTTSIHFDPAPDSLSTRGARWDLAFGDSGRINLAMKIVCAIDEAPSEPPHLVSAYWSKRRGSRKRRAGRGAVSSSNELFNAVVDRAVSDLDMLLTDTEYGLYPYAGVPWYSTIFGRDGIITAIETLWIAPDIAKGVLTTLAATQATDVEEAADAEPGKILHEMRGGEMARLGEVPFRRYYGSIDATPLFVLLAGMYLDRSGDLVTIRAIWPQIRAALRWIDEWGDRDGDGFVEYQRMRASGLANQGWKDSFDSIFHADGRDAEGPIALCEVQAYVYAAKMGAARIARALGDGPLGVALEGQAEALRQRFEDLFWLDEIDCYALALDGKKQPCRVRSSNAGHALFAGIAAPERADRLAAALTSPRFFSGWGVRTIAAGEARYNPMSYHNGSVWPHDNALIALGLARYGRKGEVVKLAHGMIEAAIYDELHRLPELFCGFTRRRKRGPTAYPVACSPQAWSAAAPFALIAAAAGLEIDHDENCLRLTNPALPQLIEKLTLNGIGVAGSRLDLWLSRVGDDVSTAVVRRVGDAAVRIVK